MVQHPEAPSSTELVSDPDREVGTQRVGAVVSRAPLSHNIRTPYTKILNLSFCENVHNGFLLSLSSLCDRKTARANRFRLYLRQMNARTGNKNGPKRQDLPSAATISGCDHERMKNDDSVSLLAETNWRNNRKRFGLRQEDRRHHMYVIGKTGTGKSTLLATLLRQDTRARTWRRACRPARRLGRTRARMDSGRAARRSCLLREIGRLSGRYALQRLKRSAA